MMAIMIQRRSQKRTEHRPAMLIRESYCLGGR